MLTAWMEGLGLEVFIDHIGNMVGIWRSPGNKDRAPVMAGSHIDTVINAGIYDGSYGVLSGLEVIETLLPGSYALYTTGPPVPADLR